jgi:uncharacterized membrane protein YphA (DoxX/SURF4 family)
MNPNAPLPSQESLSPARRSQTRVLPLVIRILMGLPLIAFGLNGFFNFLPQPKTPLPAGAAAFTGALMQSGYMMQLIGATLLLVGVLLALNRFVPLALALFAPFIVNSLAFHACLQPAGLPMAGVFLLFELYLSWIYRHAFRSVLAARVSPA